MAVYQWKPGSHVKLNAQKVGETFEKLESNGTLTPSAVVDASRRKNAPLHDFFEWDDEIAAEKYRETQASYLIRSIEIISHGTPTPVRAFVSVTREELPKQSYMSVERALSIEDTRESVLETALAELRAFERKYAGLKELANVIAAIRQVA